MHAPQRMQRSASRTSLASTALRPLSTTMKYMCSTPWNSPGPLTPVRMST
jgi:hypothetical protein